MFYKYLGFLDRRSCYTRGGESYLKFGGQNLQVDWYVVILFWDKIIYVHAFTYIITKIQQHTIKYTHPYHFIKTPASIKYISSSKESKGVYIIMTCILIGSWLRTSINKINTTSKHNRLHDMLQINKVINTPIIKHSRSYEVKQLLLQSASIIPRNVTNVLTM